MIEILRINDEKKLKEACEKQSISYDAEIKGIEAVENGKTIVGAFFKYKGETGEIIHIFSFEDDKDTLYGLGKAVLNIMDLNGVKKVSINNKLSSIAKDLGFNLVDNKFFLNLEGYFACCKKK